MGATTADEGGAAAEQTETRAGHAGEAGRGAAVKESETPGQGGAKRSAGAYAGDFYAGPVIPPGAGEAHSTGSPMRRTS